MEHTKAGVINMKEAVIEAVKEFFRVVVLAIIPVVIAGIEGGVIDWKLVATVGAIAGLRFVDKLLHEIGKAEEGKSPDNSLIKGLTRF